MITSSERPHMYFDVDSTLVRPIEESDILPDIYIRGLGFMVNHELVYEIEVGRARGHVIVVWSQGGVDWARTVVDALDIKDSVDFVLAKPSWYADDKLGSEILDPTRRFFRDF
jgi:hypothetical protein